LTHHPSWSAALKWDPAGGTSYTAIGQVKDISGPDISRGDIDVTDHDSASGWREFLPGLSDGGTVSFPIGLDTANTAHIGASGTGLLGDFDRDGCTMPAFQLTLNLCSGTGIWTFDGYPNGFSNSYPVEGENTADLSIKVTGKPTLAVT